MANPITRRFRFTDIELQCSLGAYDFEKTARQRIIINIEVSLEAKTESTDDDINSTLNYDEIRNAVIEIATAQHFDLQETLARRIFDRVVVMPSVIGVMVRIAKPDIYKDVAMVAYELSNIS